MIDRICIFFCSFNYWLKYAAKTRHPISFRTQYMLSTTSPSSSAGKTNLLDMEELRLPSLEVNSDSLIANRPWTYTGAIGPPTEVRVVLYNLLI